MFTDACFSEDGSGGLGGVLLSSSGTVKAWFALPLSKEDVEPLLPLHAMTGIGELETIAVVLGFKLWGSFLASTNTVAYVYNEGARGFLVKGYSKPSAITRICHACATLCEAKMVMAWYARVPSASNIADAPSKPPGLKLLSAW